MLKICKGKLLPELQKVFLKILFDFVQAVITDEILDNSLTWLSLSLYPRIRHCHFTHGKHCSGAIKIYRRTMWGERAAQDE